MAYGDPFEYLGPSNISSLWSGQEITLPYTGCPHTTCPLKGTTTAAGAHQVESEAHLLTTTTTTISKASPKTPKTTQAPHKFSVTFDPVSASLSSSAPQQKTAQKSTDSLGNAPTASNDGPTPGTLKGTNTAHTTARDGPATNPGAHRPGDSNKSSSSDSAPSASHTKTATPHEATHVPNSGATKSVNPPVIVIGTATFTQQLNSAFVISSQTLYSGSSITIGSGSQTTVIAIRTGGSHTVVEVGTLTPTLRAASTTGPGKISGKPPVMTIDGSIVSANSASDYVIDGQTLSPGTRIVVSGTTISMAPGATELIVGTTTEVAVSRGTVGGYIWSALGGQAESSTPAHLSSTSTSGSPTEESSEGNSSTTLPTAPSLSTSSTSGGSTLQKHWMAGLAFAAMLAIVNR